MMQCCRRLHWNPEHIEKLNLLRINLSQSNEKLHNSCLRNQQSSLGHYIENGDDRMHKNNVKLIKANELRERNVINFNQQSVTSRKMPSMMRENEKSWSLETSCSNR